jgi:transcriptional regulator of acetoin/glycerol metabolism
MSDGRSLKIADFQFSVRDSQAESVRDNYNLEVLEKWAIDRCLKKHGGNISKAATELGLTRGSLYRRMEKYDLQ